MTSNVTSVPAAASHEAVAHFSSEFRFETDCWDVHDALSKGADFVLLDVRGADLFAKGHVPGAINLPHGKIIRSKLSGLARRDLVRHLLCRAALQWCGKGRAQAGETRTAGENDGRGRAGWLDEGFELTSGHK